MTLTTGFIILLYALVVPYIGLMLMVFVGILVPKGRRRSAATPSVSVIIPAHNEEAKLTATLHSLSEQRYEGALEFVIVNDRSHDATPRIIDSFAAQDARFRRVDVTLPSRRLSPKVNAVDCGIRASTGKIILTSDADCQYPQGWVHGMVSHFTSDVAMVVGYVESTRAGESSTLLHLFESTDWLSLMLTSMALTHFGWKFASSANNQGYRRSAFERIGGFGAPGRAPSGDEDLLTQRMGRLQEGRIVFASSPETRVLTQPMPTLSALLNQRRRWASRYRHVLHYHPAFLASIAALGFGSAVLSVAIMLSLLNPALLPWVVGLWAVKLAIEWSGMYVGTGLLGRRDLWGVPVLLWAPLHPFFIGTIAMMALLRSGEWRAGAHSYRRRFFKRQWREWRRKLRSTLASL